MKKYYFLIIPVLAVIIGSIAVTAPFKKPEYKLKNYNANKPISFSMPGEFDKQQAIWMQWPSEVYNEGSRPVNIAIINIIKAFAPYIKVNLMTRSTAESEEIRNLLMANGYSGGNVKFLVVDHFSIWARDVGPIFIKDNRNRLHVVNFDFNNYSRDGNQHINIESQIDKKAAKIVGLPVIDSKIISEGGAIESNGRGTLMLTESVVLKRNPGMTKLQIEDEYKRVLGVRKILWLKRGLAEDDGITGGHINEIARFADPHTILLAQVLPTDRFANNDSQESYLRLEENYKILLKSTDQDGKPFKIIRIPMPPTLYSESNKTGELPVRSYLNYAATNGAVLIQTYWKPGRSVTLQKTEQEVKAMFKRIFPGRNIIGIDAENINRWGGGIHCITQHMPAT